MYDDELNIANLKSRVINKIITAFGIISTVIVTTVFFRDYPDNVGIQFFTQCLLLTSIWVVAVFRHKITLHIKVYFLVLCLLFVLINSFLYLGFLASAKLYIVLTPVLISYVQSYKRSLLVLIGFLVIYASFGFLFVNGIVDVKVNASAFIHNAKPWITETILLFLVGFCLLYVSHSYLKEVLQNLSIIKEQNSKLSQNESELILHRDRLELLVKEKTQDLDNALKELKKSNEELLDKNKIIHNKNLELEEAFQNLKETQAQLIHAEKMASLGVLTAGVAHEINNPLNFISGGTTGLETIFNNHHIKDENVDLYINSIKEGVERASNIVSSLNQLSKTNEIFNEDCDIHDIIDNCLTVLNIHFKNRVDIIRNYSTASCIVLGNVGKLHQVFLNILTNAIQSIENKGWITISTAVNDGKISIKFEDTGCGISKENLLKITDPFFTTKDPGQGTGLGLSIARTIIEEHKGKIRFESELNIGTSVIIELPKYRN